MPGPPSKPSPHRDSSPEPSKIDCECQTSGPMPLEKTFCDDPKLFPDLDLDSLKLQAKMWGQEFPLIERISLHLDTTGADHFDQDAEQDAVYVLVVEAPGVNKVRPTVPNVLTAARKDPRWDAPLDRKEKDRIIEKLREEPEYKNLDSSRDAWLTANDSLVHLRNRWQADSLKTLVHPSYGQAFKSAVQWIIQLNELGEEITDVYEGFCWLLYQRTAAEMAQHKLTQGVTFCDVDWDEHIADKLVANLGLPKAALRVIRAAGLEVQAFIERLVVNDPEPMQQEAMVLFRDYDLPLRFIKERYIEDIRVFEFNRERKEKTISLEDY
jgi:hypothetical protein